MNPSLFDLIIFDCDGVILNSNHVKTNAFSLVASHYGESIAAEFTNYHKLNGGVSRYAKFDYLLTELLPRFGVHPVHTRDELLEQFKTIVFTQLTTCQISPHLSSFRHFTQKASWAVVSGGDQDELRSVLSERNVDHLFNAGIHGSPRTKYSIIESISPTMPSPDQVLFIGDSILDYEVASHFGFSFAFLSAWSEVSLSRLLDLGISNVYNDLSSLIDLCLV